ncbi:HORMA domain-containing protein 2 [Elsinoe australis]|uniref:HORMA domain-containing protein 2 n=1 Tax=Elsinoe australis TaxID=40998 RepID=A0A4V6DT95_9PEZI|nr:HORMA domain-containing protein 2 [Elsinoe australis]
MTDAVTYRDLIEAFTTFLTVSIHTIIYERNIYPANSFISARKYNYSVRQNRHPRVCKWITDAVSAVEVELLKCSVDRVAVVIYDQQDRPLERFMFDVARFPVVPTSEQNTPLERTDEKGEKVAVLPMVDLEEQFRGTMSRLSGCGSRLNPVPEGCTFTIAVELKGESDPPVGHPQAWIPAQPGLQKRIRKDEDGMHEDLGDELGGVKTTTVRSVAAGDLMFEVWIEEGKTKFEERHTSSNGTDHG